MDPSSLYIHVIDFEGPTRTTGTYLSSTTTWSKVAKRVRCRIRPLRGSEVLIAAQLSEKVTHKLYCAPKDVSAVSAGHRAQYDGRMFKVVTIREVDEAGIYVIMDLEETSVQN